MLDQSFTLKNLRHLVTYDDFINYRFGAGEQGVLEVLNKVSERINQTEYSFSDLKQNKIGSNTIYSTTVIEDDFSLRKLNDNLKRLYKFRQANRFLIIQQLKSLLSEDVPMSIIKLDIKKFYETVDSKRIFRKLLDDPLLSFTSKQILKKFFSLQEVSTGTGLPRGINISASLSEILMRDFDRNISSQIGVYFYARYVDDIIIFTYKDASNIAALASEILEIKTGLKLNKQKTRIIERQCRCKTLCVCTTGECKCYSRCHCSYEASNSKFFEYLGYRFCFPDISGHSKHLVITLALSKIKKIKTRIMLAFLDYIKTENFVLLEKRIGFLTSNFIAKRSSDGGKLYAGIFYNYPLINDRGLHELEELNVFFRKTLNSKNKSFGIKLNALLSQQNRTTLSKYNFKSGFINRRVKRYTSKEINMIKKCWINE